MSSRPVHLCRNSHTEAQEHACLALRYKLEGRTWEAVARLMHTRDVRELREKALAHLSLESDRAGLLVHEASAPSRHLAAVA